MDNKEFLEIYKEYQGKSPEKDFKHIPDISFYNFNYYVGLKREGSIVNDLLRIESWEDCGIELFYVLAGRSFRYIGYSEYGEGLVLTDEFPS